MSVSEAVNAPMVHQSLVRAEASHPYAVEALETLDALDAIADEWRELEERATGRQIFQTFSWCRHWAAQALGAKPGSRARMRIVTVRAKGRLVLIWPVAIHRCRSVRKTSWLGEPNSQYGDILAEPGAELAGWALQAWNLMKSWSDVDVLHFARVRADALVAPFLSSQAPSLPNVDSALAVDLTKAANWDELNEQYPAKQRKNRRRFRRRLSEIGKVRMEIVPPGKRACELLDTALKFKEIWLRHSGRTNRAFRNPVAVGALHSMACGNPPDTDCHISVLWVGDQAAAINLGFQHMGRYVAHVGSINPDFQKFGPGNVLTEELIAWCVRKGYQTYDLMAPADSYKRFWTNMETPVMSYALPRTSRGSTYCRVYLRFLRPHMKQTFDHLPLPVRKSLSSLTNVLG